MLYIVTYDLHQSDQNFKGLESAIRQEGEVNHCLASVWLVQSQHGVDEIQTNLQRAIDENDRIIVVDITGKPLNGWMNRDVWEWVRAHNF